MVIDLAMQIRDEIKHLITKNAELQQQVAELTADAHRWADAANEQRLVAMEQANKVQELTAERDELQAAIDAMGNGQFYAMYRRAREERDALAAKVDELNAHWRKSNDGWAEANAEAERWRQKCDHMQRVIDTQPDSFLKMEREYRELQDVCGELERTLENLRGVKGVRTDTRCMTLTPRRATRAMA